MNTSTALISYRYDALDRLIGIDRAGSPGCTRFYGNGAVSCQLQGTESQSFLRHANQWLGQSRQGEGVAETSLLATNQQNTILQAICGNQVEHIAYTSYGHRPASRGLNSLLGFNGEQSDPVTGCYLLGNGYRTYNPVLMRFHSPDSMSPFDAGGINPYAYCLGDPVNLSDPTGHFSWRSILKIGLAVVAVAISVATVAVLPVSGFAAVGLALDIGSNILSIAGVIAEETSPDSEAGAILGQLSLGLTVGALVFGRIGARSPKPATALNRRGIFSPRAVTPLRRQGAIRVSNGRALQGFNGAANLTSRSRNTVALTEALKTAGDYTKYIKYPFKAFEALNDYVVPYLKSPQGESPETGESGSNGYSAASSQSLTEFLSLDDERIQTIRGIG
ncbi:RHS repeat-associated core domain-containing protein [Pseudomonas huanghezhanensis]|uniref:RHS repeat-associated core domain-containing protein n=1 Tax=Pseudomonas huanghezhanensis TaxID=3002903 RepID=UPI002286A77F|nr:RHS repeat-associated core domain-containing protein [Pseudomonas sp. BSw22131]